MGFHVRTSCAQPVHGTEPVRAIITLSIHPHSISITDTIDHRVEWKGVRDRLTTLLARADPIPEHDLVRAALIPANEVQMHTPVLVGDYTGEGQQYARNVVIEDVMIYFGWEAEDKV